LTLKEFEGFGALQGEFRIAKDPYGLTNLEESLVHNWDSIRNDIAIKDFLNYCEMLSRDTGLFSKPGKGLANKLNIDFMSESKHYIDRLADIKYFGNTSVHRYNITAYKNFYMKMRNKFGKNNVNYMYLSRPNEFEFIKETRSYIHNLFSGYMDFNKINTLVLDQAVSPTNITNTSRYFENIKIIIIDRDPRDIYANLVKNNALIGADLSNKDSADRYIKWHNILRVDFENKVENLEISKAILRLNFEDLVCNYEHSVDKIIDFFGGRILHKDKCKYFNPDSTRAKSNVGLWKTYKNQNVMNKISKNLEKYCHNY